VTGEWARDGVERIRLEVELARVKRELKTKTRKLKAVEHRLEGFERQIADLKALIEVRKVPIPRGAPEISDYYED
jgi:hypothetical protein